MSISLTPTFVYILYSFYVVYIALSTNVHTVHLHQLIDGKHPIHRVSTILLVAQDFATNPR